MPKATVAAILILVLSAGISFGFVVQRGGIDLPVIAAAPGSTAIALAPSPSDRADRAPERRARDRPGRGRGELRGPEPIGRGVAIGDRLAVAVAQPVAVAERAAVVIAAPDDRPGRDADARGDAAADAQADEEAESDRYKLLDPCPSQPNCWIYTVRSGDNLYSIAHYFGIPMSVIYDWNPRYANGARLRDGDQIRMPPPRR